MSPVPRNSGLLSSGVPRSAALDGGRVIFRDLVGIEPTPSGPSELIFAHDAFVAVQLALYPILENARGFGQQTDDLETPPDGNPLVPIG